MPRSHNPNEPIIRTRFQKIMIWIIEFLVTAMFYYFSTRSVRALNYFTIYAVNPEILINKFPFHFWISILIIIFLAKTFKRSAVILGASIIEFLTEYVKSTPIQPVLIGFVIWDRKTSDKPIKKQLDSLKKDVREMKGENQKMKDTLNEINIPE